MFFHVMIDGFFVQRTFASSLLSQNIALKSAWYVVHFTGHFLYKKCA